MAPGNVNARGYVIFPFSIIYFKGKVVEEKAKELGLVHHAKGKKRLAEEVDMEEVEEKRIKTNPPVFKEPLV